MRLCCLILVSVLFYDEVQGYTINKFRVWNPRICIIGAGLAGLTSAKSLQEEGLNFTLLEATDHFGGTWKYEPRIGHYPNGLPVFSSMYKHLRTNLPKPLMELRGFPMPEDMPSFSTWEMYYGYLKNYVKHFDLEKYIQFEHYVIQISRQNNVWKVKHKFLPTGEVLEDEYDYVIIGTGHFSLPNWPKIKGEESFKGTVIHSHDYREPEPYRHRKVLVVGTGPSGIDIAADISNVVDTVYRSHHEKFNSKRYFSNNYVQKPDIREFTETGAIFVDGTYEDIDDVIYCTGYLFDFPFLDESTGLTIQPKTVQPLYKHIVNINQPTMLFIGLVDGALIVQAIDVQSRYAAALIKGKFSLPSKEVMMKEWQTTVDKFLAQGRTLKYLHNLVEGEEVYYEELSKESGIERLPPVIFKIRDADYKAKMQNLQTYRNYDYKVIDDNSFVKILKTDKRLFKTDKRQEIGYNKRNVYDEMYRTVIIIIFPHLSHNLQIQHTNMLQIR